jgi:hypothetical protein
MKDNNDARVCECGCGNTTNLDRQGRPRRYMRGHNRRRPSLGWLEGGYWYLQIDGRKVAFHRQVLEEKLGRRLTSNEVVHHMDGDPLNNDPENLEPLTRAEHTRLHRSGKKGRNATKEERDRVVFLHRRGMTLQQVANATGRPFSTVSSWVAAAS